MVKIDTSSAVGIPCDLSSVPATGHGLGATGHRMISRMALETLHADMPAFLKAANAIDLIGELGREPDRSKGTHASRLVACFATP